jgi:Bacterial Ig-like domain (group 3)
MHLNQAAAAPSFISATVQECRRGWNLNCRQQTKSLIQMGLTSELSAGSHSITASYTGDSTYAASTSSAVAETVTAAGGSYALGISPSSLTIGQTGSGTSTVTITPAGGFNQQITFSCSGLPSEAACSFSPSTVTPSGTAVATTTLTIATGVSSTAAVREFYPGSGGGIGSSVALGLLLLPWTMMMRRRRVTGRGIYGLVGFLRRRCRPRVPDQCSEKKS